MIKNKSLTELQHELAVAQRQLESLKKERNPFPNNNEILSCEHFQWEIFHEVNMESTSKNIKVLSEKIQNAR